MKRSMAWLGNVSLVGGLVIIAGLLHAWGAREVRGDAGEVVLLTFWGGVCLLLAKRLLFPCLGLSFHDDVVERRNRAALVACCGALLAFALIYAGGSMGEGLYYRENIFSIALGTSGWFLLWILIETGTDISRAIAEERDLASGIRLGGLLLANGLILGRAVAGDWHSKAATLHDFMRDGWPALVLCAAALLVEKLTQPSLRCPFPPYRSHGLVPAFIYLVVAIAWLCHLGAWEGMSK